MSRLSSATCDFTPGIKPSAARNILSINQSSFRQFRLSLKVAALSLSIFPVLFLEEMHDNTKPFSTLSTRVLGQSLSLIFAIITTELKGDDSRFEH